MNITVLSLAFLIAAAEPRDACQLLTKQEVAAVQGEQFSKATLTTRVGRSQCFYEMPNFVDSISLDVIRGEGRAFWSEHFEREAEPTAKKKQPPKRIKGIGDDAYWVGSRTTGSLYVLRKQSVLRVSVGGKATEEEKIARSKKLAAKALRRL